MGRSSKGRTDLNYLGNNVRFSFRTAKLGMGVLCALLFLSVPAAAQEGNEDLAAPDRELNLPDVPDMKPISSLSMPSAEEENDAFLKNSDEWKDVKTFVEDSRKEARRQEGKEPGLFIRYEPLPDTRVVAAPGRPISSPEAKDKETAKTAASSGGKSVKEKKIDAPPEACQALADMRRRQLEAIESDRKTLSELRKALAELGLSEQLKFMPKTGESVSTETADGRETPGKQNATQIQ